MSGQKGLEFLLAVETTPSGGTYVAIGGMRSNGMTINNEVVDVTNKSSSGVRTLLEGAGVNSIEISGSAAFFDDAQSAIILAQAKANTHVNYQLTLPSDTTATDYTGAFAMASCALAGEYNGEITLDITLQSAGVIAVA
tara:strand:- start:834 stop:1250 length:417 start_codon:yes stop_codon:yes gene_type:complete